MKVTFSLAPTVTPPFHFIGSSTGTYCTGHGESWKSKWQELLDSGYIVDVIAKKKGKIPHDWNPPVINKKDKQIVSIFQGENNKKQNRKKGK
ncbi:MAG: hypothetical protein H6753_05790 [Candidatus Omnitrophica bacterium]|nr:hypothetical protein [Candidatus Omnitrophota bacterium]